MLRENSKECSTDFPYDEIDGRADPGEELMTKADCFEALRKIVRFVRGKDRARLTLDCLHLALGDSEAEATTMTVLAEEYGLTKAAVSKRTKEIREQLHLSINANNKSAHAVEKYRNNRSPLRLEGPA